MSDFQSALQAKLARNSELAAQRAEAEREMDRAKTEQIERAEREAQEQEAARRERHGELVEGLAAAAQQLKVSSPEHFVVRVGWTQSGEEYIAKISTRQMHPQRSLFVELDRDDDEVLVRWHSDIGNTLELWRLLEVTPVLLEELVLQAADQDLWRSRSSPPPFPSG